MIFKKERILLVGVVSGLVACFLTWLLMTDTSSPLQGYLLHNPWLRNLWGDFIFPVYMVAMVLGLPNYPIIAYLLVFLQCFLVGSCSYLVIWFLSDTSTRFKS